MTDRTPTGDLRERIAEEIHLHCPARPYGGNCRCTALADAVLPGVEAETAALRQRIEEVEDQRDQALAWQDTAERIAAALEAERDQARAAVADEQRRADERRTELLEERDEALDALANAEKRAEQAERQRDQALNAIADERRGRLAAEAAVRRAREIHRRHDCARHVNPRTPVPCVNEGLCDGCAARYPCQTATALDAEQPKETP